MMANQPYDRYGKPYDITRVLTPEHTFDVDAYNNYSPLYLPASYAITYLIAFALSSAMIVHTLLYHGRTVLRGFLQTRIEKDDIHAKLMRAYPEVPDWWYLATFAACFALAIVTAEVCRVHAACPLGDSTGFDRFGIRAFRCGRWCSRSRCRSRTSFLPDTCTP